MVEQKQRAARKNALRKQETEQLRKAEEQGMIELQHKAARKLAELQQLQAAQIASEQLAARP